MSVLLLIIALMMKWLAYGIGGALCLTVVLSPIGIALIIWGRRQAKRAVESTWDSDDEALAIGLATSWDDFTD